MLAGKSARGESNFRHRKRVKPTSLFRENLFGAERDVDRSRVPAPTTSEAHHRAFSATGKRLPKAEKTAFFVKAKC
jgi:hypothetical protein